MLLAGSTPRCVGWLSGLLALLVLVPGAQASHPDPLPSQAYSEGWTVLFSQENPYACMPNTPISLLSDRNFLPLAQAEIMLQSLVGPLTTVPVTDPDGFVEGLSELGFYMAPPSAVFSYDCAPGNLFHSDDCDSGTAVPLAITMPATLYCAATEQQIRRVIGHEHFHLVQYMYLEFDDWTDWGRTLVEGTARMMEDQVFSDLDSWSTSRFVTQANEYLANPQLPFWWASYDAALGWKYAAEQFGTTTGEPEYGNDFMVALWNQVQTDTLAETSDAPRTVETTMQQFSPTMTLERWFQDFGIANLARLYDLTKLTAAEQGRYSYVDENNPLGTQFAPPMLSAAVTVPGPAAGTVPVSWWATTYLRATSSGDCRPGDIIGMRGVDTGPMMEGFDDGDPVRFAVLGISGDPAVGQSVERVVRGGAREFGGAFLVGGAANVTQVDVVLTGTSGARMIDYAFDCGAGAMTIGRPTSNYKAYVGPPGPDRQLLGVIVRVTGPSGISTPTVKGLQREDFSVYVGTNNSASDKGVVLAVAEAGESYFLTVLPPDQPATGPWDLHVNLQTITASSPQSVSYEEKVVHEMTVLDRSGSMGEPGSPGGPAKLDAARSAASALTDWARADGKIGVVAFDSDATLVRALGDATSGNKEQQKVAIHNAPLAVGGFTSIGDGADLAASELVPASTPRSEDWILLLTDGKENAPQLWSQVEAAIVAAGIKVFAFGLGADADHGALGLIADVTGGEYLPIDADPSAAAASFGFGAGAGASGDTLANDLADAFLIAGETAEGLSRLWEAAGDLTAPQSHVFPIEIEEGGVREATFSFHWSDPAEALSIQITRPDLSVVTHGVAGAEVFTGGAHVIAYVDALLPGTWQVQVTAASGSPSYIALLSGRDRQGPRLELEIEGLASDPAHAAAGIHHLWGIPQQIVATLIGKTAEQTVTDAQVAAAIEHPDGSTLVLPLFDDGDHLDGQAEDGVYANAYPRTTHAVAWGVPGSGGSYRVVVTATGTNSHAEQFTRIRKRAFVVAELGDPPADSDGDGMPDRYELRHACLDPQLDDRLPDPDLDTLSNIDEWLQGTDPCHPDTDRGGESDGSEALRGANPFDPEDDALPLPLDPEVIDWVLEHIPFPDGVLLESNKNLIRYPVNAAYATMEILRAPSSAGPYSVIATLSGSTMTGLYEDIGLDNGTTYYYRVRPLDLNGNVGAPSRVFWGTPTSDPIPPIGNVLIEDNSELVDTTAVTLSLVASADVTEVMISNGPNFTTASWQPYGKLVPWTLAPDPATGNATVFVRFRDAHGNESPSTYAASIRVVASGSLGRIIGRITVDGLADLAGIGIRIVSSATQPPVYTGDTGAFFMPNLPPGAYDVVIERSGYAPVTVENVQITAGRDADLGTIALSAMPAVPLLPGAGVAVLIAAVFGLGGFAIARERRGRSASG